MTTKTKDWYTSWFNTPYYHILYRDRGYDEAQSFLSKLLNHLNLSEDSHILDLACGKGRHSLYLNRMGYE
ncbi:MAG: SAM-dependent methyltransferase, partial [Bacteroidia bacterium]|nr:SAM-dependent methyltransferase [Bacteroidia bacterium]